MRNLYPTDLNNRSNFPQSLIASGSGHQKVLKKHTITDDYQQFTL